MDYSVAYCLLVTLSFVASQSMNINDIHYRLRSKEIQYVRLSNINSINHGNVSELYQRVIETDQLLTALKGEMVGIIITPFFPF